MPDPYLSEIKYLGQGRVDFIEIAVDEGSDVSGISVVVYHPNGTVRTTNALLTKVATEYGKDIYVLQSASSPTFTGVHRNGSIALVEDGTVLEYVAFSDGNATPATEGPADGLTPILIGSAGSGESLEADHGGGGWDTQTTPTPGSIPCFTEGVLIETPGGARPIDSLIAGDQVVTLDGPPVEIRWIGKRRVDLEAIPGLQPVLIPANAFDTGRPTRDLIVSPNHRILIGGVDPQLWFAQDEVLVAAKHLVGSRGITRLNLSSVTYVHIMFDQHEIVLSDGLPSESFHPGEQALSSCEQAARNEIFAIFPELRAGVGHYGPTARMTLKAHEAALLAA